MTDLCGHDVFWGEHFNCDIIVSCACCTIVVV